MRVDNFNPNSPNSCVSVCVSVAESCNSPNSLGASHTRELAKCRASDYSRQMPNLNLMPDPIILGNRDKWKVWKKIPINSRLFLLCFLTDSIGNIHHFNSDRRFYNPGSVTKIFNPIKVVYIELFTGNHITKAG